MRASRSSSTCRSSSRSRTCASSRSAAREPGVNSIWPSIYPALLELVREHRSTIVFVNNRRLAERLALRLNELAEEEVARAHHGSLAREQRVHDRGRPEGGPDPVPRRDVVARARHRHGRRRPRRPGRVAEVGRARAAAHRPRGPFAARGLEGPHLPEVPRRPARVARSSRSGSREGAIEETQIPRNPLDVLAQQIVGICAIEEIEVADLHRLVRGAYPFADLSRAQLENVLDMLAGRYPVRRVRRAAPAHHLGPHRRCRARPRGCATARRHERGHDPRPRPLRRLHRRRRRPRRRARRGDGLRGARRPGDHARRVVVAHRGHHARPRARVAGARRARGRAVLEGRGRGSAVRARRRDRQVLARARLGIGGEGDEAARRRCRARRVRRAQPAHVPARSACARRESSRPTAPSSSSASATRSATGASASSRRSVRVCTRRGRWRSARGCATRSASRCSRSGRTTGSRSILPDADAPPSTDLLLAHRGGARRARARGGGADGALRRALPRERGARAADPAPASRRALAALAAAAEGAGAAAGRAQVRELPDRARDVSRVPAGRVRPAGAEEAAARVADARDRSRRCRVCVGVAVRVVASLRLHRDLHVRGRHAAGGAARAGALARPRPAARAARAGGAARADRRRRAGRGRGVAAAAAVESGSCCTTLLRLRGDYASASSTRRSRRSSRRSVARCACASAATSG